MASNASNSSSVGNSLVPTGLLVAGNPKTAPLTKLGFEEVTDSVAYRLVVCTTASEKSGKTTFALTAPTPIAAISTDAGTIEIAKGFRRKGRKIVLNQFRPANEIIENEEKKAQAAAEREWERMKASYTQVIEDTRFRSMVVDTATEMWELCRLARFGKLTQVMPHHYGPVNAEFKALINKAYDREDLNVILIHKVKKEYKALGKDGKEVFTGKWERAGFGDLPYIVDVNVKHFFQKAVMEGDNLIEEARFGIEIIDSRVNMLSVVGLRLEGELCNFAMMAESMFPETMGAGFWE